MVRSRHRPPFFSTIYNVSLPGGLSNVRKHVRNRLKDPLNTCPTTWCDDLHGYHREFKTKVVFTDLKTWTER
jgi:hypothetical protein